MRNLHISFKIGMRMAFILYSLLFTFSSVIATDYIPRDYVWTTQSHNSSESMPCGGYDIGMNVWVEGGDVLFYISRSGAFDENNTLLKAGRFRLHLDPCPFNGHDFLQILHLDDGSVEMKGGGCTVRLWADVNSPVVYAELSDKIPVRATMSYESWRYRDRVITMAECQQCSYKWLLPDDSKTSRDTIAPSRSSLLFYHQNPKKTVFDYTVNYEHLDSIKSALYNPIGNLVFGGRISAPDFRFIGATDGKYASTDYRSWNYQSESLRHSVITISLFSAMDGIPKEVKLADAKLSRKRCARWWHDYWQRSYVIADSGEAAHIARNYELFRYMLGCNARGEWPTKFNGGLFTFDPVYVDKNRPFTPDFRCWGGGTMTAQNQRLVYWPMLKSGDTDMMASQLDTYLRMLPNAVARTRYYWQHDGASFTEQMENFGLPNPAEYGKHPAGSDLGMERNQWLEYLWDTSLEFCLMALQMHDYADIDIAKYQPMIRECLTFFDEHYRLLARQRGAKELDGNGRLIIYPGSGCETFKIAYNPASTVAALRSVLTAWGGAPQMLARIPDIPLRAIGGDTCVAPAVVWARVQNEESPQLYPVFPWRIFGLGRPHLDIARNTYLKDPYALKMRSSKGWKQDNIWSACLGLTDEAARLAKEKFADGPYRFPAFWPQGFDWAPDCNRGGSAMIGLQEMLLQERPDGSLMLFPAWPKDWNARFRLHATGGRTVDAEIKDGIVTKK